MRQRQMKVCFFSILAAQLFTAGHHAAARNTHTAIGLSNLGGDDHCQYIPGPADAEKVRMDGGGVVVAWYGKITEKYTHGVLGDALEAQTLYAKSQGMSASDCALQLTLNEQSVFEDVSPRIADVTGDGLNDIITIESHINKGASLSIYGIDNGQLRKISSTPYIGQAYRWLAPVGKADFNADGVDDVAFVQTPHLAGILQIWSFKDGLARRLASKPGFSNHRIGENFTTGGVAYCHDQPLIIVPDRLWQSTMAATFSNGKIQAIEVANAVNRDVIDRKLACQ